MFNLVKTFSATKQADRERLGDRATEFIRSLPNGTTHEVRVLQSSDHEFHCVTLVVLARVPQ